MIAMYPGSFDPPTVGHLDIIRRAAALFDRVYVCVMVNIEKRYLLPAPERVALLKECAAGFENVIVLEDSGLSMDAARKLHADVILKGLRGTADYAKESAVADAVYALSGCETLFIQSDPALAYISSGIVKECLTFGGDITKLVPAPVFLALNGQNADKKQKR